MNKNKVRLPIACLVVSFCSVAARADLAERIDGILASQKGVHYSIHVVEAESGRTAYAYDDREALIPASNMKIITGAAALEFLGPQFEYKTRAGLCGDTLVVVGSGDPLLGDRRMAEKYGKEPDWVLDDIAEKLKTRGVRSIEDIVVDTTIFDDQRVHPRWPRDQLNRWYACEVSGLNYNNNCVDIIARRVNGRVVVTTEPLTRYLLMINEITPIAEGDSAIGSYRNRHPNKLTLKGRVSSQATLADVAIERPAGFLGFLLAERLASEGIKAEGKLLEKEFDCTEQCDVIGMYTTRMADCLDRCNKNSLGLVAECFVKTIAAHNDPARKDGNWEEGCELIGRFLSRIGIDESQYYIDDGSGLSRQNELSAHAITTVLLHVYRGKNWDMYARSLAVGGLDGTLRKHFKQEPYKGRIRGKTGYIAGVKSLSGICSTDRGDYIFSVLGNSGPSRSAINSIAEAIIDEYAVEADDTSNANGT